MSNMKAMTIDEKIRIIENSASFADIPSDALPPSHKDNYYFVSYSHKDYKEVLKDILRLEALGVNIWYDNEMHIGENWREIAELYLSKFQCAGVIFYLTENSILSPACNQEVEYVLTHDKQFLSINKALDGRPLESGYGMLNTLIERGFKCEKSLVENFKKAFPDEVLFLDIDDSIERKAHKITSIPREDLLTIEALEDLRTDSKHLVLTECKDNSIISVDLSKEKECDGTRGTISEIGDCVFTNSVKLARVKLPQKLQKIGENAFRNCRSLTDINLTDTQNVEIGNGAFMGCTALENIDLTRVKSIGERAFMRCSNLNVDEISGKISRDAFYRTNIQEAKYVAKRAKLADFAFYGCNTLKRLDICGTFFDDLGVNAFGWCESLEYAGPFNAPQVFEDANKSSVKIGAYAFNGCVALKEVEFRGAWDIAEAYGAFRSCRSLSEIALDVKDGRIPRDFAGECVNLSRISGHFTEVGEQAFLGCRALSEFDFTDVTSVGKSAFFNTAIGTAYLKNVREINKAAFSQCKKLKRVYIGKGCRKIESMAFLDCEELNSIKIYSRDIDLQKTSNVFGSKHNISTALVCAQNVYDLLYTEGIIAELHTLYLASDVFTGDYSELGFTETESGESGFRKFIKGTDEGNDDEYAEILTDRELNAPDEGGEKPVLTVSTDEILGHEVLIKHKRLKAPHAYFVEKIDLADGKISSLTVSVHSDESFVLDGTLIESLEVTTSVSGKRIELDAPDELDGRSLSIIGNGEGILCTAVSVKVLPQTADGKYPVDTIVYDEAFSSDESELCAISGLDVRSITVFSEDFDAVKTIYRD